MTSELKRIEDLGAVVDALEQGKAGQLVEHYETCESSLQKLHLKRERRKKEREESLHNFISTQILPYFSWQKGKEMQTSFSALKERTGYSEPMLGRIGEQEVDYCGQKMKLKEFMYDSFVREAAPYLKIARILNKNSHQRAQQYLHQTGQYTHWRQQRDLQQEQKRQDIQDQEKNNRQRQLDLLLAKVLQYAGNSWSRRAAILVDLQKVKQPGRISILKLEELFWHYQKAVEDNEPVSFPYLSEITGLNIISIPKQLRYLGLQSLDPTSRKGWRKKNVHLSVAEKKRVQKSKKTFSRIDLPFFLGLPFWLLESRRLSLPDARIKKYGVTHFSYRLASEIYQARDDFTPAEVQYVLEIDDTTYHKYLTHQKEISKEIILKLRQIYPELGTKIKHPYLTPEIRRLQQEQTLEATVLQALDTAIKAGVRGLDQLERITGFGRQTIKEYSKKKGISLPLKYRK